MTRSEGLSILQDAALSPHGVLLHASNPASAVQALERIRKAEAREDLAGLAYRRVAWPDGNLVIVKAGQEAEGDSGAYSGPPKLGSLTDL